MMCIFLLLFSKVVFLCKCQPTTKEIITSGFIYFNLSFRAGFCSNLFSCNFTDTPNFLSFQPSAFFIRFPYPFGLVSCFALVHPLHCLLVLGVLHHVISIGLLKSWPLCLILHGNIDEGKAWLPWNTNPSSTCTNFVFSIDIPSGSLPMS